MPKFSWDDPFIVIVVAFVVNVNKRWADVDLHYRRFTLFNDVAKFKVYVYHSPTQRLFGTFCLFLAGQVSSGRKTGGWDRVGAGWEMKFEKHLPYNVRFFGVKCGSLVFVDFNYNGGV